jgi:hypothetical protein
VGWFGGQPGHRPAVAGGGGEDVGHLRTAGAVDVGQRPRAEDDEVGGARRGPNGAVEEIREVVDHVPAGDRARRPGEQADGGTEPLDPTRHIRPEARLEPADRIGVREVDGMPVDPAPAHHGRQHERLRTVVSSTVGTVPAGTTDRRRRVPEDDPTAGSGQLHAVAVDRQEQAGAGAHLDEDHGAAGLVPADESERRGEVDRPVDLVGLRAPRADDGAQLVRVREHGLPHVGPRVTRRQAVAADDAGVPPGRGHLGLPQHEVVQRGQPEDRAGLSGGRGLEEARTLVVTGQGAADRAVERQLRVAGGEVREPALQRGEVRPGRGHPPTLTGVKIPSGPRSGPRHGASLEV